ncbi:hypothetical protein Clacol_004335 [Clathrus columnatus]|uniref:Uncharacterized protein n=1 Tax=Clathrus columnatus TaxID=1419009 RepID=A0AAV5A658_9AGAM|nr:hypothetical protein Clacol_004335 [Clathrus columnatus]
MQASLFTSPSSPPVKGRQLPQHPKMRLSYILNPSPPTSQTTVHRPVIPAPVPIPAEAASESAALHDSSQAETSSRSRLGSPSLLDAEDSISTPLIPEFLTDSLPNLLHYTPLALHGSTTPEIPPIVTSIPGLSDRAVPSSISSNSNHQLDHDHDASNSFSTGPLMNQEGTELTSLGNRHPIHLPPLRSPFVSPHALNFPANSHISNPQSHVVDVTSSSLTAILQPIPQHPKMTLSYILNPSSPTGPKLVIPNSVHATNSRYPSPAQSESESCSSITSDFHSETRPHDQSPPTSPATTPPSSPQPIHPPMPDLPNMVEPPQLLPWEGPPPPGLDARNHQVYQQAGVHWMLVQIFGSDLG